MRNFLLLILSAFALIPPAQAENYDLSAFGQLPIMHEGRIKPIDSFARANLKQISGSESGALPWLVETLFNPAGAENIRAISIRHPDVVNMLGLDKREDHLYAQVEIRAVLGAHRNILRSALQAEERDLTQAQKNLIKLHQSSLLLDDILSAMSLFLPLAIQLPDGIPDALKPLSEKSLSYVDLLPYRTTIDALLEDIVQPNETDIEAYSEVEQALIQLSFRLVQLDSQAGLAPILRVIPLQKGDVSWTTPRSIIKGGAGNPQTSDIFHSWKTLANAYHDRDTQIWNETVNILNARYVDLTPRPQALKVEFLYNVFKPYHLSLFLYVAALLMLIGAQYRPILTTPAALSLWLGAGLHIFGMAARIYILERPPVSTLYESILFVGLVAVLFALLMHSRTRTDLWAFVAAGSGIFLHLLAFAHTGQSDDLMMLSAVLNTNFWLTTHVICITLGYAFCMLTSILAHVLLVKGEFDLKSALFKQMHTLALIALMLCTTGTVLGGIWADQSWGRFWGWDPKENGAMLIVLWLIWVLHGRISGQMSALLLTAGLAYLSVIVALSWFGVNILSVGLHAYGFTDTAIWGLGVFTVLETLLIGAFILKHHISPEHY